MCAGLARWLRVFGVDSSYQPGIKDADLVHHALREHRVVVSADGKLFERRVLVTGELAGLRLPVGLRLYDQFGYVVKGLGLHADAARCALCNGKLLPVQRTEVADVVPARSLIWARGFQCCSDCGHTYWEGTHWRRIRAVRESILGANFGAARNPR